VYSLRRRLLIFAALLLVLFLGLTAIGLNNAFEKSVLSNAQDSLQNQVLLLVANIDVIDGQLVAPEVLSEPRLSQTDSDLCAQIVDRDNNVLWRSPSLLGERLPLLDVNHNLGEFRFFEQEGLPHPMYSVTFALEWETDQGDIPLIIQVSEHSDAYTARLARYQKTFGVWLSVLGVVLLTLLLILLGWVLKPLNKVAHQVNEIEQGQRQRFDEDYPLEVSRLTQNLNQLLNFDEQRINQQKEVLGNLAHSLKTPIAVMKGLNYSQENKEEANTQLGVMQNIIDYQLQSASTVGRRRFSKAIEIKESTEQIINSLQKLHANKGLSVDINIDSATVFYGEKGDWMEVAGNLLDNAFKWANSHVAINVSNIANVDKDSHRQAISIMVADDGAGIDDEVKQNTLQRGVRLDSQTPGHGLGLHIVKGIVQAYEGELSVTDNQPKGTCFHVVLN